VTKRRLARVMLLCGLPGVVLGQNPFIFTRGIVNAATFASPGLPNGGIAQGSVFSVFGKSLGPAVSPPLAFPLTTSLGGVSIQVTQGSVSVNIIPLVVSPGQINALMPSNAPLGAASLRVSFGGRTSNPAPIQVVTTSFGIYAANSAGLGPGILQNFVAADNQPINAPSTSAKPGQTITMWGTGLGPALGADNVAPAAGNLAAQTEVFVGGKTATVAYHGRSPCCSGSDQVIFTVPADAPTGCWVPVFVRTEGKYTSNAATIAISADGSPCRESSNPVGTFLTKGGKLGAVIAFRQTVNQDLGVLQPVEAVSDDLVGVISQVSAGVFPFHRIFSLPPAGACTIYSGTGNLASSILTDTLGSTTQFLDAGGAWSVAQAASPATTGPVSVTPMFASGSFAGQIGASVPAITGLPSNLFLNPGSYTLSTPGGVDVSAFQAAFSVPAPFAWTGRDDLGLLDRTQALTLNWTGTPSGYQMFVAGGNVDKPSNSSALFFCSVPSGATSFTIPAPILSALPATQRFLGRSQGALYLGAWNLATPASFSASGLDLGVVISAQISGKTVVFQ
jgi:uncharacterized protein (TIGR03437 family)